MATFGPTLRRTREQRGISLDEIVSETRLSKRYLLALEDEAISKLPGGTYNRAYLRSYATFLGLDADALLREYAAEEARVAAKAEVDQMAAMNRAIERRGAVVASLEQGGGDDDRRALLRMAGLAAAAALVLASAGGLAWYGWSRSAGTVAELEVDRGTPADTSAAAPTAATAASAGSLASARPSASAAPPASTPVSAPSGDPGTSGASTPAVPTAAPPTAEPAPATETPAVPTVADNASAVPSPGSPAAAASTPAATSPADAGAPHLVAVSRDVATASDSLSHLSVAGSGVGTGVIDRQLVGQSDRFAVGSKVVFWTHVRGGRAGDTIDHVWFRDGVLVGAASLTVGSPDWRTQSRRLLDPPGTWVVEARDAEGHVLVRHEFRADTVPAQ